MIPAPNVSLLIFYTSFVWLCLIAVFIRPVAAMEQEHRVTRKRSLADVSCSANQTRMLGQGVQQANKKLRRLPHVFSRVLELPVKSDADVLVEISSGYFRFVVGVGESNSSARVVARAVQVYPCVVRVVVGGHGSDEEELRMDGLELDKWRFRLPVTTRPERTTAVCVAGELVVTVPRDRSTLDSNGVEVCGGVERLVEVM